MAYSLPCRWSGFFAFLTSSGSPCPAFFFGQPSHKASLALFRQVCHSFRHPKFDRKGKESAILDLVGADDKESGPNNYCGFGNIVTANSYQLQEVVVHTSITTTTTTTLPANNSSIADVAEGKHSSDCT